jgi:hypothetical protein
VVTEDGARSAPNITRFHQKFSVSQLSRAPSVDCTISRFGPWACIARMTFSVPSERMRDLRDMPAPSTTSTASWPVTASDTSAAFRASPAWRDSCGWSRPRLSG